MSLGVAASGPAEFDTTGAIIGGPAQAGMSIRGGCDLKVTVLLFASYREKAGTGSLELDAPDGSTVGDVATRVSAMYPGLAAEPSGIVVAVNREYRDHGHRLSDGDEVAFIPPVSGGAA